jgi:hypothetical protein
MTDYRARIRANTARILTLRGEGEPDPALVQKYQSDAAFHAVVHVAARLALDLEEATGESPWATSNDADVMRALAPIEIEWTGPPVIAWDPPVPNGMTPTFRPDGMIADCPLCGAGLHAWVSMLSMPRFPTQWHKPYPTGPEIVEFEPCGCTIERAGVKR